MQLYESSSDEDHEVQVHSAFEVGIGESVHERHPQLEGQPTANLAVEPFPGQTIRRAIDCRRLALLLLLMVCLFFYAHVDAVGRAATEQDHA